MHVLPRRDAVCLVLALSFSGVFLTAVVRAQNAPVPRQNPADPRVQNQGGQFPNGQNPNLQNQGPAQNPAGPAQNPARMQVDPRVAGQQALAPRNPQQPPWWPQPEGHQKYVDQVLIFWEQSSKKIDRYRCKFKRWEYDVVWGPPPDPKTGSRPAARISHGEIKYAKPDKGYFEVKEISHYTPPQNAEDKPRYVKQGNEIGEKWVCDGLNIFEFDHARKRLVQHELPPELRGQEIVNGPLPFLFGADAAKIKQRYWVGVFTPPGTTGEYWLEAWPKFREDAKNYQKVEIIIDEKDFLPKALQIYEHSANPRDPSSTVLTFDDREVNFTVNPVPGLLDPLKIWHREFHEPSTPFGWKKEVVKFNAADGQAPTGQSAGGQATRPQGTQASRSGIQIPLAPRR